MSGDYFSSFDPETKDVINYLKSKTEICDLCIHELAPASANMINDWEMKNSCIMSQDMKQFYLKRNGLNIEWKFKIDNETTIPLGKLTINNIFDLTKVGTVLQKDLKEPSLFELEELQDVNDASLIPHFDDKSRNFEIDNCNGYGKVCLVYRNTTPGATAENAEFWYLDRSLRWHFITQTFTNYYRLLISHLGLPQWQSLFSDDGLPPFLTQWYYMLAPGRLYIHDENIKEIVDSKKSKHSFDPNKVFKEKDNQKKSTSNQMSKSSSAPNIQNNNALPKRKNK